MLRGLADFDGHKVSYEFHPEFGGRIVEGLHGAEEGHPLTFRVENQIGYVADSIYVNGAAFEADYVTDNDDGPHTAWYSVPEIYEEQEVGGYRQTYSPRSCWNLSIWKIALSFISVLTRARFQRWVTV